MHRFKNILFSPLARRDNPAAVRRVADLAGRNEAQITLFGVLSEPSPLQRLLHRPAVEQAVQEAERRELANKLERWDPSGDGVEAEKVLQVGNPALAIIQRVLQSGHDLVVVTSDEDREDQATIKRLLRKCPCPLWVIRPTRARIQRVLAAVNPDSAEASLNHTILELAASMAEQYGGELHVGHAWELYGEGTIRSSALMNIPPEDVEQMLHDERAERQRKLEDLLASGVVADAPWQRHLQKGPPAGVVTGLVAKHRINLLVMGTVARTGLKGALMGNTAEKVLDEVHCSVIALKPPGFVSPIQVPTR